MKRTLLLVGTLVSFGMNVQAQEFDVREIVRSCKENVSNLSWQMAYAKGKFHAQEFQTALNRKDWNEEEKYYLDTSQYTSRHGIDGITRRAEILIGRMYAKMDNKPYSIRSKTYACLMGEFQIYESQPWSGVHQGFIEYLSDELNSLYFSLPTQ